MPTDKEVEADFRSQIELLQSKYNQKANTAPAVEIQELVKALRAKKQEYMLWLLGEAKECPNCKVPPLALQKTPSYTRGDGVVMEPVYEIGCVDCWRASRSFSITMTRSLWNAETYIPEPVKAKEKQ